MSEFGVQFSGIYITPNKNNKKLDHGPPAARIRAGIRARKWSLVVVILGKQFAPMRRMIRDQRAPETPVLANTVRDYQYL